ncbi:MAG: hypothetical protein PHS54_01870, partial [Clostridia bacterium]|nr:hypothetical protein [Clostridia bacterium]
MKKLRKYMERKVKKLSIFILVLIFLLPCAILWGCGAQVQTLAFSETNKTILVNESYTLNTTVTPEIENVVITYSVADITVAQILPNGKSVLGIGEGQTKVYATSENGIVAEMTLNVIQERTPLSTPTGLTFDGNTRTLRWISVLSAYSYEVTVSIGEVSGTFETFTNRFLFDDFELDYEEYTEYEFSVEAKPSPTSKIYTNSLESEIYTFKQTLSVQELRYDNENIIFEYDTALLDLDETGDLSFELAILKDNEEIINEEFLEEDLVNDEITFHFLPTEAGQYTIRVYAKSENLEDSIIKEIQAVKLITPQISSDGESVEIIGSTGTSLKYFKIVDDVTEEITVDDLIIGTLLSGEEVTYEAYSYKQNIGNIFYINSGIASFTIKKLETPENVKIEKISGDNNSVEISWDAEYEIDDYKIYVNDSIVTGSLPSTIGGINSVTLSNIFDNAGIYTIQIVTSKNAGELFYLDSDISLEVSAIKLAVPELEYDQLSNSFELTSPDYNIGAEFNFYATLGEYEFNLSETILDNESLYNLSGLNLSTSGTYQTTSSVTRETITDTTVYLDSEIKLFNVNKLSTPELTYQYNISNVLTIVWDRIENAGYLIQVKNITRNIEVTLSGSSITQNGDLVSIDLNNLENGNQYEIYVTAISLNNFSILDEIPTQFLSSEKATLAIYKLEEPVVTITSKDIGTISFDWEEIDSANSYDIYIDGNKIETIAG